MVVVMFDYGDDLSVPDPSPGTRVSASGCAADTRVAARGGGDTEATDRGGNGGKLRFECTGCGDCCKVRDDYAHVYLNPGELRSLAALLGMSVAAFKRNHTYKDALGWTQLRFEADHCPFLDPGSGKCEVYEARPTQCRTYPFWRSLITDGRWHEEARRYCEGVGRGRAYTPEEAESLMVAQEHADEG